MTTETPETKEDKVRADSAEGVVTLKALCAQLKVDPYEARQKLRAAVSDAKEFPALAKSHKPKKPWEWPKNSPALKEARAVLVQK